MIKKAVLSKPDKNAVQTEFGKEIEKIKISLIEDNNTENKYFVEMFTKTQVFHKNLSQKEAEEFLSHHESKTFKNCVKTTDEKEITTMVSKKGKISSCSKKLPNLTNFTSKALSNQKMNLQKNYIIQEGKPVPFLVELGVMTKEGKVVAQKYDKFRQINRYLEFIKDILPNISPTDSESPASPASSANPEVPIRIIDFGCGKSYLTFAVHYYLTQILGLKVDITGLDLKNDVVEKCNQVAKKLNCEGLKFYTGSIESYLESVKTDDKQENHDIDLVMTLHACDTATDYALASAIKSNAKVILSVPCCQHELNQTVKTVSDDAINAMLKYGIVRERFFALATDVMRCELLKENGYSVQLMEFIDMENTPKNLLIRAVQKSDTIRNSKNLLNSNYSEIENLIGSEITLSRLLKKSSEN